MEELKNVPILYSNHFTATYCYNKFLEVLKKYNDFENEYTFIEPSAGNGCFS